jgi:hypothetical protein
LVTDLTDSTFSRTWSCYPSLAFNLKWGICPQRFFFLYFQLKMLPFLSLTVGCLEAALNY